MEVKKLLEHPEIWKDVKGYEGLYQVSDLGRVRSLERKIVNRNGKHLLNKERILSQCPDTGGYLLVHFSANGFRGCKKVHNLVAEVFLGEKEDGYEVNHKNGINTDNRYLNLEYATHQENMNHRAIVINTKPRGVYTKGQKWVSVITFKGQRIKLGDFLSKSEAYKAYYDRFLELRGVEPWDLSNYKTH
jgi:phage-related protein